MRGLRGREDRSFWVAVVALVVAVVAISSGLAAADSLGFYNITHNNVANAQIGEAQLFVDVTDAGGNQVLFTFHNVGPEASSITDVYFDDGTLFAIGSIVGGSGVNFSPGASPPNLPGGNDVSPPFQVTQGFLADSDPSVQPNGVNPTEWLKIYFDLVSGMTFSDVITALRQDGTDPDTAYDLRIGIHVQGFADGGSESFVNRVPEPSTLLLLGAGLLGLGFAVRRRRKKA